MFDELTSQASFTRIEEEVQRFWRRHGVPEAFRAVHRQDSRYTVCQQPLAAAGQRWADQVHLMTIADLLARYRVMRGDAVRRWAGWACHGLPVEVAVEQRLGSDLADYSLAQFNAACRSAAVEGMQQGEALAERLGVWLNPGETHVTLASQAISAVWGGLRRLWDANRLKRESRVVSVCPRCATPLSAAEAARRATEVEALEIWVQLPWDGEPHAYLLAWTPSPWMLMGMVALAAHPDAGYALIELPGQEGIPPSRLLLAESALRRTRIGDYRLVRRLPGRSLRGTRYHPPFTFLPVGEGVGRVLLSEDVPLDEGTGFLPVTPTFDALSLSLAQAHDLPVPELLDDWGSLDDTVMPWRGLSPLDAEVLLTEDLRARGLVFAEQAKTRMSSLCPYCQVPLIPQARDVWLVETASGPWIVGRDRAWGGPLPVWVCEGCGQQVCVAGLDDLAHRTGLESDQIDLHRPAIDRLTLPCEACGGTMRWVEVIVDAAFEAAVLPWATMPELEPANLAVGLGDRHLGWLGDLTEVAALLYGSLAWQQAVTVPEGESDAAQDLERVPPADALRWASCTGTTPDQAEHDFLRPLWKLIVTLLSGQPATGQEGPSEGIDGELPDRWLLARLYQVTCTVSEALEACDPRQGAEELAGLVRDLAGWYVPHLSAGPRLSARGSEALGVLSRLLAPFTPHLAEAIHRHVDDREGQSIHLTDWPLPDSAWMDQPLLDSMGLARRLAALGQVARVGAGIDPERLLPRALIDFQSASDADYTALLPFQGLLARVMGVVQVEFGPEAAAQVSWRLSFDPDQGVERDVTVIDIETALALLEPSAAGVLASQLWAGLSVSLEVAGQAITLLPDEVRIAAHPLPGWIAAADAGHLVALEVG